jgi:hypothetical protein
MPMPGRSDIDLPAGFEIRGLEDQQAIGGEPRIHSLVSR